MAEKKEGAKATENSKPGEDGKPGQDGKPGEDGEEPGEKIELPELGPFEIITGRRFMIHYFKFQFKNVEYSSGRNKTFLCYVVETLGEDTVKTEGFLEDEHSTTHAEDAFFNQIFGPQQCSGDLKYRLTWYVSSSPCAACATRIVEFLRRYPNVSLTILAARLFMWEEPEVQDGLRMLKAAGCRLRIMKPVDFIFCWDTYVENEGEAFQPWEDIQENSSYHEEKLHEILEKA
uniref:Apolipoprotein B mRNA editing enzyme, catalytic polypeptide-like 2a n=1 Tax=Callorhinchus milii TaxID=7868 RepID=V9L332_CALMI|eukprot:gi/632953301/ref/XP_007892343.1/ PREDICTED: probable C-_U-editing enzyme APOBEC-2 [Callorhinchus milii]